MPESNRFSRRQLLRFASVFAAGTGGTLLFGSLLWGRSPQSKTVNKSKSPAIANRHLYVRGRHLYAANGSKIILRGVNLPIFDDWDFPRRDLLGEVAKTGANAIRIQWYKNYGQADRPTISARDLDRILTKCRVYLADLTCKSEIDGLNSELVPWWISPSILAVLKKHQRYLIINLANELGHYRWTKDPDRAASEYKAAYKLAITSIRQHLRVPIAIDAPDCGSSIDIFLKVAKDLIASDPARNLLFSGHAYWAAYNGTPHVLAAIKANIPLFFGEIANKQDEEVDGKTSYCHYDLDNANGFSYRSLLGLLQRQEVGWLGWCWWKDKCNVRQISANGSFAKLTPYGRDLVYNRSYGLQATAKKPQVF
jgi:mannan endo-1,4-beta-mannosidase